MDGYNSNKQTKKCAKSHVHDSEIDDGDIGSEERVRVSHIATYTAQTLIRTHNALAKATTALLFAQCNVH